MEKNNILEKFKMEQELLKNTVRYDRYLQKSTKLEKPQLVYSEKTKEMFKQIKQMNEEQKATVKPQKDKAIGKASQRRGNGRGCI